MGFETSLKRGVFYGFVPQHLEIKDRPELNIFPLNVMFMQFKVINGETVSGSALYQPELGSYRQEGDRQSMEYRNVYGPSNYLTIQYDKTKHHYQGEKIVGGVSVGLATGPDWQMFFVHFTALGLANGERCKFSIIPENIN